MAQLYTQGKNCGIHMFMVQIRDLETHMPLPGKWKMKNSINHQFDAKLNSVPSLGCLILFHGHLLKFFRLIFLSLL